jgi:hypothetical protein
MLSELKGDIQYLESLQGGGKDIELRREFNALAGGDVVDWNYWKNAGYGYAKASGDYISNKASSAGSYIWNKTKSTARDKAAAWNKYLESDEYKEAKKKAGDKAKVWAMWAVDNGIKNPMKRGYDKLENMASRKKCATFGSYARNCVTDPATTEAMLRDYDLNDLRRLSAHVSDRIVELEEKAKKVPDVPITKTDHIKTPVRRPHIVSDKATIEYKQKVDKVARRRSARLSGK